MRQINSMSIYKYCPKNLINANTANSVQKPALSFCGTCSTKHIEEFVKKADEFISDSLKEASITKITTEEKINNLYAQIKNKAEDITQLYDNNLFQHDSSICEELCIDEVQQELTLDNPDGYDFTKDKKCICWAEKVTQFLEDGTKRTGIFINSSIAKIKEERPDGKKNIVTFSKGKLATYTEGFEEDEQGNIKYEKQLKLHNLQSYSQDSNYYIENYEETQYKEPSKSCCKFEKYSTKTEFTGKSIGKIRVKSYEEGYTRESSPSFKNKMLKDTITQQDKVIRYFSSSEDVSQYKENIKFNSRTQTTKCGKEISFNKNRQPKTYIEDKEENLYKIEIFTQRLKYQDGKPIKYTINHFPSDDRQKVCEEFNYIDGTWESIS